MKENDFQETAVFLVHASKQFLLGFEQLNEPDAADGSDGPDL